MEDGKINEWEKKKDSRYRNGGISGIDWGQEVREGLG